MARVAASLLLVAAALLGVAPPAFAHADLASTDPASGAALDALPSEITLTFTEAPLTRAGLTVVQVTDAAGRSLTKGEPHVEGAIVTQQLAGPAAGPISVAYRVITSDGHATSGTYTFTVAGVAPTATPTPTPTYTPPAVGSGVAAPTWNPTPQAAASGFADVAPLLALLTGLFAALLGAVVVLLRALRRPPRSEADSDR